MYLKQSRIRLMLLHKWQHGGHAEDYAEDEVEGDEELVELAVANVRAGVVGVAQGNSHNHQDVEQESCGEKGPEPVLVGAWPKETKTDVRSYWFS